MTNMSPKGSVEQQIWSRVWSETQTVSGPIWPGRR